jgi:DNA-binding NarL/FixJ family response regulator
MASLTYREKMVLDLVCQGCSAAKISSVIGLTLGEVNATVDTLLEKHGAADRGELIRTVNQASG